MSMYREQIMDHYKNPRNFGELKDADVSLEIDNPLCGDKLKLQIKYKSPPARGGVGGVGEESSAPSELFQNLTLPSPLKGEGIIADAKFTGTGCAISMASASLFTEFLKNKTRAEILTIDEDDIYKLLGTEINPGRAKCALLPLSALRTALVPSPLLRRGLEPAPHLMRG